MGRVVIVGSQGAGKSYLAVKMGKSLHLPVTHLDELFWSWRNEKLTTEERNVRVRKLAEKNCWIIDGNFLKTLDYRVARCDTAILLDLPRWLCLWRLTKRRIMLWFSPIPNGEIAPHQWLSWPMVKSIWRFPARMTPRLEAILRQHDADVGCFCGRPERSISFLPVCHRLLQQT